MGKHKIEIKRIEDEPTRQVTFSKRREGLFSKANQLCNLVEGAEVAVIVFSPIKERPYVYGQPSVDSVIDRFLVNHGSSSSSGSNAHSQDVYHLQGMNSDVGIREDVRVRHIDLNVSLHEEDYEDGTDSEEEIEGGKFWWEQTVDHMDLDELMRFKSSMEKLKKNVDTYFEEMPIEKA